MTLPRPMTANAAGLPRDPSGRVLKPVKIEVKFASARGGYRKYVSTWAEATAFLASADFARTSRLVKSVTITAADPDAGPARFDDREQAA